MREQSGFTLVELLVVVIVIGILAAIAIPRFLSQRTAANDAAAASDLRNLAAVEVSLAAAAGVSDDPAVIADEGWEASDGRIVACVLVSGSDVSISVWHLDGETTYSWQRSVGTVFANATAGATTCPAGSVDVS